MATNAAHQCLGFQRPGSLTATVVDTRKNFERSLDINRQLLLCFNLDVIILLVIQSLQQDDHHSSIGRSTLSYSQRRGLVL